MITLNHLVRKKGDVSSDHFQRYWLGEHAERSLSVAPALGVRNLTKCETQHDDEVNQTLQQIYGTAADAYDFVDQMVIGDLEVFKKGLADTLVRDSLAEAHKSESAWLDHRRSDYWFSVEIPQVFGTDRCVATWSNTLLKVFYVPQRLPHLSLAEAQFHWNSCHGAMARQFVEFLPYSKYVQGHRVESTVCNELKALLGDGFESIDAMIGQAEAWIDRRTLPGLQGPETERMMGMLVQDISLFVDAGISHIFATKEHTILDCPVITEPVPSLFSAN